MDRLQQQGINDIGVNSDPGLERSENQDSYKVVGLPYGTLLVVADGMGGHQGGSTASKLAVETIIRVFRNQTIDHNNGQAVRSLMAESIIEANHVVWDVAQTNPDLRGMGTTVVMCLVIGDLAYVAHVGDSRLYYCDLHAGRVTKDHTQVQEMIDRGTLTPAEAKTAENAHRLSRAVGAEDVVDVEVQNEPLILSPGNSIVLCSDGLYDVVSDSEIGKVVAGKQPQAGADALVNLANSRGGPDNVTVIVYRHKGFAKSREITQVVAVPTQHRRASVLPPWAVWALVAFAGIAVGALLVYLFLMGPTSGDSKKKPKGADAADAVTTVASNEHSDKDVSAQSDKPTQNKEKEPLPNQQDDKQTPAPSTDPQAQKETRPAANTTDQKTKVQDSGLTISTAPLPSVEKVPTTPGGNGGTQRQGTAGSSERVPPCDSDEGLSKEEKELKTNIMERLEDAGRQTKESQFEDAYGNYNDAKVLAGKSSELNIRCQREIDLKKSKAREQHLSYIKENARGNCTKACKSGKIQYESGDKAFIKALSQCKGVGDKCSFVK